MAGVRIRDRSSGEVVTVEPAEAQRAVLAGNADLADRTVRVVGEGGRTGTVDAEHFAAEFSRGWSLTDDAGAQAARRAREAHSVAGQAVGAVEAGARGLTFGLSDMAATGLGADPEAMRARQEAVGGLGTALEVAGAVAPTLVTGGTAGAAGLGLRGALRATPAALAARAGEAVAGRALGAGAGRVARAAVAEGVEGALAGAGQKLSEAALWDRDVTAEDLAHGALLGGVLGAGGAASVAGLGAAVRGTGRASVDAWRGIAKAVSSTGEEVSDTTARALRKSDLVLDPKLRRAATDPSAVQREITDAIAPKHQRAAKLLAETNDLVRQAPGRLRKVDLSGVDTEIAERNVAATRNIASRRVYELAEQYPDARKSISKLADAVNAISGADDLAGRYSALDELGGAIEREADTLSASNRVTEREAAEQIRSLSRVVGDSLDDEAVWKRAARGRKDIRDSINSVAGAESTLPAGLQGGKLDPAEVVGLARKGEIDAALGSRLRALETIAAQRELPKSTIAKLDEAKREIEGLRRELKKHGRSAEALEVMSKLGRVEDDMASARDIAGMVGVGKMVGAVAGGLGIGGLGTVAAMGVQAITRPRSMIANAARTMDFVSKLASGRDASIARFGKRLAGKAVAKAKIAAPKLTREAALKVARDVARVDPMSLVDDNSDTMQHLAEFAPRTAAQAQATAAQAIGFLRSKAPAQYSSPWGGQPLVDPVAADRYARYAEAVLYPSSVWQRLSDGTLTREHVEALQAVFPNTYRRVQDLVFDELGKLRAPPPYDTRVTIGTLLQIPADPSLNPRHRKTIAQVFGAPPEEPQQSQQGGGLNPGGAAQIGKRATSMMPPHTAGEQRKDR